MVQSGAVICVTLLRVTLLSCVAASDIGLRSFNFRCIFFWLVPVVAEFIYLKAALSDPGKLRECPTRILKELSKAGQSCLIAESQLRIKPKRFVAGTESEGGSLKSTIGRRLDQRPWETRGNVVDFARSSSGSDWSDDSCSQQTDDTVLEFKPDFVDIQSGPPLFDEEAAYPGADEPKRSTLDVIKKSLLKAGYPLQANAPPSAIVGAALSFAVAATAAGPIAIAEHTAHEIAGRASRAWGHRSDLVRSVGIGLTRQGGKEKKDEDHHIINTIAPSISLRVTDESNDKLGKAVSGYKGIMKQTTQGVPVQCGIPLRWCDYCSMYQPLRTKHCEECDFCVRTSDHHCPWLGNCVGEGNRIRFYNFLLGQAAELVIILSLAFQTFLNWQDSLELVAAEGNVGYAIITTVALLTSCVIMIFLLIMVICLIFYHTFLAMANLTTWENVSWGRISYLKHLRERKGSPFSRGIKQNLQQYFLIGSKTPHPLGPEGEIIWIYGQQQTPFSCC